MTKHPVLDRSEKLRAAATRWKLDCLDTQWAGVNGQYRFVCSKGHLSISAAALLVLRRKGCRDCELDDTTDQLRTVAHAANVTWLEPRWLGSHQVHSFRCQQGHTWERTGAGALASCRCPHCDYKKPHPRGWNPHGWARLKQRVAELGGECLTLECGTPQQAYSFRCAAGHTFRTGGYAVVQGSWCTLCAREKRTRKTWLRLQDACTSRGGICLSPTYQGFNAKHFIRCAAGHEWEALCANILRGSWCIRCHLARPTTSLEDAQTLARGFGGRCLSSTFVKATQPLQWACEAGHCWSASLNRVYRGHWCAECNKLSRAVLKERAKANRASQLQLAKSSIGKSRAGRRLQALKP
jgi:hypothetical protein